jgi:hypothetical protein
MHTKHGDFFRKFFLFLQISLETGGGGQNIQQNYYYYFI